MRAVADTGPLHYLALIGHLPALSALFSEVAIPDMVRDELPNQQASTLVQDLVASPPTWLSINTVRPEILAEVDIRLDPGERAALALAIERNPDLVLIDDRAGVATARTLGFVVTGTLGILARAARHGWLDLPDALDALSRTNFHWTADLRARVLAEEMKRRGT